MIEAQLTPSQAARRFADENGFKIVTVDRRYKATHSTGVSFERGGYPALLNEMRAIIGCIENGNAHPVHGFAVDADATVGTNVAVVDVAAGPDRTVVATVAIPAGDEFSGLRNQVLGRAVVESRAFEGVTWGALEPVTPDTVPMSREEMFAPVKAELDRLRNFRIYGDERGMKGVDYPFDDFDAAAQERIRHAANRIAKQARKTQGTPRRVGPFMALVQYAEPDIHGDDTFVGNFATRPEALKWIRRHLSGPQGKHIIKQTISVAGVRNV
jgi:hypothetical protein